MPVSSDFTNNYEREVPSVRADTHHEDRFKIWLLIVIASLFYSASGFSGLEYHGAYFGNVMRALLAESFIGDIFKPPVNPYMASIYYWFPRMVGELWLDDRFTIVVYLGLVVAALVALDKTARLLGAERLEERVIILSLLLLNHQFKDNLAHLVSTAEFNATTFAGPVALWLLYAILAGKKATITIPIMVVLFLISIKNAWMPAAIGLAILFKEGLGLRGKVIMASSGMLLGALALVTYYVILRPPDETHVVLFDDFLRGDNSEANPFMEVTWIGNILFLALCVGGFLVKLPSKAVLTRVRVVAAAGVLTWLVGGLYLSYAADVIKIYYLIPLNFNRALWWPQYVLFVAIGVAALKWAQNARSWHGLMAACAILLALYLTPFNYRRAGLVGILLFVAWLIYTKTGSSGAGGSEPIGIRRWRIGIFPDKPLEIVAVALCATTLYYLATGTHQRLPHFYYMLQHGVVGDNPGAKWVGINEYFRNKTSPSATVLALSMRDYPWRAEGLKIDHSFRTRSGRSIPTESVAIWYSNLQSMRWDKRRAQHYDDLVERWERQDVSGVSASLSGLGSPDYLVVPTEKAGWLSDTSEFNYKVETSIREFTIMRKVLPG